MFDVIGGLLTFIVWLIPIAFYIAVWVMLFMGVCFLCNYKEGYSAVQMAGICFTLSAVFLCWSIGSDYGITEGYDGDIFGALWFFFCACIASFLLGICRGSGLPTIVVALIFWGFILFGPGDIFDDDSSYNIEQTDSILDNWNDAEDDWEYERVDWDSIDTDKDRVEKNIREDKERAEKALQKEDKELTSEELDQKIQKSRNHIDKMLGKTTEKRYYEK
ncbi:MAG: hypothetical protein ACOC5T_05580 [Elusimicrobiota bacterium]